MAQTYEHYFNIDPKYYAAVTADLIRQGKVSWKKFYPHETFVKLLETTYRVLSGKATRSIWVEGAYGTGKSHAALTMKSILDASDEDVREYFNDFGLSADLREKYISLKHSGNILTVHRIGSANIHTDMDLIMAVQESILGALKEHGIENQGEASLKDAFLSWMKDEGNKDYFQGKMQQSKYLLDFSGMDADGLIHELETGSSEEVESLMGKVMGVLKDNGIYGLLRDMNQMADWIRSIIESNHLSSILFVWDEFSEFFQNHAMSLTGFQTLIEISQSYPFYFMIVAHESRNLFRDKKTANKTLDRFEPPVKIELPENMAFKLMAQAMKTVDDVTLREEWKSDKADLNDMLGDVRRYIIRKSAAQSHLGNKTHLTEEELQGIVPLHPYAALLLKHIATVFNSNQRSMFDFIISNDMTDAKGFKWFIHQYGAQDSIYLLTIDLLWDFFCGKQKLGLSDDVRGVLDSYNTLQLDKLSDEEKRVIKTVILFQAISLHIAGNELLAPNKANLDMAFSGTDWNKGKAINIAEGLVEKKLLFKKPVAGGQEEYVVAMTRADDLGPYIEKAKKLFKASILAAQGKLVEAIPVPAPARMRFLLGEPGTGVDSYRRDEERFKKQDGLHRFKVLTTFALDDGEQEELDDRIHDLTQNMEENWVILCALTPLGRDLREQYIYNLAYSFYYAEKNKEQANHFDKQARAVLQTWKNNIANGAFMVYTADNKNGERLANSEALQQFFLDLDRKTYFDGVSQYVLNDTMYTGFSLRGGALCGIQQKLTGAYKNSNKSKSFEKALEGAWQVPGYWKNAALQHLTIVHIKKKVDEVVAAGFDSQAGRVSIKKIWEMLEEAPFGFMPMSACALVFGFVMKEYAKSNYFWTNGSVTRPMTEEIMADMINKVMTGGTRSNGKEEYIVTMTPEVRNFLNKTAEIFQITGVECNSVEDTKKLIRLQMKKFDFPLWTVKSLLSKESLENTPTLVAEVIDEYCGIANEANYHKEDASMLAEKIGRQLMDHPALVSDLKKLCSSQKTKEGMQAYLDTFQGGILPQLAAEMQDNGRYMERIKTGFSAGEANWVWNQETADGIIQDVICEYQIVKESSLCIGLYHSYADALQAWKEKANKIRIPYEILKNNVGALGQLLEALHLLCTENRLMDKASFYHLLCDEGQHFKDFDNHQFDYFCKAIATFDEGLDKERLYNELYLPFEGQFTRKSTPFYQDIQDGIRKIKDNDLREKLKRLWKEKTGTENPKEWSRSHQTPILCLLTGRDLEDAKQYFPLIGQLSGEKARVQKAIDFLEQGDFYEKLQDANYIDRCFMEGIVGDASILLKDKSQIRSELYAIDSDVYHWRTSDAVKRHIRKMRDQAYLVSGKAEAEQVFLSMSAEELRSYLKDKLMDPDFGLQILKGRK